MNELTQHAPHAGTLFLQKVKGDLGGRWEPENEADAKAGADRVELYTEPYASEYPINREEAIRPFVVAAEKAREIGLGLNAGHDLSLENLGYLCQEIPFLDEVSIGHALIADALYLGLEETIRRYHTLVQQN